MVMMESLLAEVQAANERLGKAMDEFLAELAAARDWARTVGAPHSETTFAVTNDEWAFRTGPARRGTV